VLFIVRPTANLPMHSRFPFHPPAPSPLQHCYLLCLGRALALQGLHTWKGRSVRDPGENEPMARAEEEGEHCRHAFVRHNFHGSSRLFWNLFTGFGGGQAQSCATATNFSWLHIHAILAYFFCRRFVSSNFREIQRFVGKVAVSVRALNHICMKVRGKRVYADL